MDLDPTTPLLVALALLNAALVVARASLRAQLFVGLGLVVLSSILLRDWIEGALYLALMP